MGGKASTLKGAGYGVSAEDATDAAVSKAVSTALETLGDLTPTVAFVSCTVDRDIEEVRKAFVQHLPDNTPFHGITSSGALLNPGEGSIPKAVGCLVLAAEPSDFVTAFDSSDSTKVIESLKGQMEKPKAIFMGATPGTEEGILAELVKSFPGVPVFGGTAADNDVSGKWSAFSADESSGTGISLVGIGPGVHVGGSMLGPYTPTSKTAIATKTDGRRVFEIDDKPAADWVLEWLGDGVKKEYDEGGLILPQTATSPIAVQAKKSDEYVTAHCAAFGKDGETSYVDFFAPVPQGAILTVMDSGDGPATGYATALCNAYDAAKKTVKTPKAGLLVYCGGMAIAVGDNLDNGLKSEAFAKKSKDLPVLGMTCFGEQGCLPKSKTNTQRNLSVGMVVFG